MTTEFAFAIVSVFGLITWAGCTFFCGGVVTFFGGAFEAVDGFVTGVVFGVVVTGVVCFTHSRNVISSNAKSFPQPLGILSIITNINVDVDAGVVKFARCCVHRASLTLGSSPVTIFATIFPSGVSNRMFRTGNNTDGHYFVG